MAPGGLAISKLVVEVRAGEQQVKGCLCARVVLSASGDARPSRICVFPGPLRSDSPVTILPLPLAHSSPSSSLTARHRAMATQMLGLDTSNTLYPQERPKTSRLKTNASSEGIFLSSTDSPRLAAGEKQEWAVVLDFDSPVQRYLRSFRTVIPTPRCLDNAIRLSLASTSTGSDADTQLETRPKMRFLAAVPAYRHRSLTDERMRTDGWEDGEDTSGDSDQEWETDEEGAEWREGKFPSTDTLELQWTAPWPHAEDTPVICLEPTFTKNKRSSIANAVAVRFESSLPPCIRRLQLEAVPPSGWKWEDLSLSADSLQSWQPVDGPMNDYPAVGHEFDDSLASIADPDTGPDDSFATVRARKSGSSILPQPSVSLFRQTPPQLADLSHDFSFETTGPSSETPVRSPARTALTPRSHFQLDFDLFPGPQLLSVEGILTRISPQHKPDSQMSIPIFYLDDELASEIRIECASASLYRPARHASDIACRTEQGYGTIPLSLSHYPPPASSPTRSSTSPDASVRDVGTAGPPSTGRRRAFGLLSWSTLLHLFLVWLVISMAQQLQRIRTEVALVREGVEQEVGRERELRVLSEERLDRLQADMEAWTAARFRLDGGYDADGSLWGAADDGAEAGGRGLALRPEDALARQGGGGGGVWGKVASHPQLRAIERAITAAWRTIVWLIGS